MYIETVDRSPGDGSPCDSRVPETWQATLFEPRLWRTLRWEQGWSEQASG